MRHTILIILGTTLAIAVVGLAVELAMIKYGGAPVPVPNIPRAPENYGNGKPITYVVLGDSTAVGQGGTYDKGIARSTARIIGQSGSVTMHNFAISGAQSTDVLEKQIPQAIRLEPEFVLLAVGANDVTHLVSARQTASNVERIIKKLQAANPNVKIVMTGTPEMGSIPRFPQPIRHFAGVRTEQLNTELAKLIATDSVVLAPIARETGPIFSRNRELFAADNFHPTTEGYKTWIPVLEAAIEPLLDIPETSTR